MRTLLNNLLKSAILDSFGDIAKNTDPALQMANQPELADYQANFAMKLAKILNKKPQDIANTLVDKLSANPVFKSIYVSGPGFLNIQLDHSFLSQKLEGLAKDDRLGVLQDPHPYNVVVDYANANVAKEMHVGHIRSIVIGDAIVRILGFLGHTVIRQSHLGDWGTQFGMLIEYLLETGNAENLYSVTDLDALYKQSKQRFDQDLNFAERARARVVALQRGDEKTLGIWKYLVKESLQYFQKIYDTLGVLLVQEDARGESFYNSMLADLIHELEQKGLVIENEGAKVMNLPDFEIPFIVQKKDGGYLYATTDLAAAKFRTETLGASRIIYLTDTRQQQHFAMLFSALSQTGWIKSHVRLEHVYFGTILGPDNKPFKTRSGEVIRLISLLEEAQGRALDLARAKNPNLSEAQLNHVAKIIGIGALKYADLHTDKIKDYVFDWDKLLSFEGNTAPYLQNAYVRIRSIFRKGNLYLAQIDLIKNSKILINHEVEHNLAIKILEFPNLIYSVADSLSLHRLCEYLYTLAATYHRFYEHCPILSVGDKNIQNSRLLISEITARVLKLGLDLLGIETLEQM